jgi:gluconate 2-dehydrogenase gamma chain
VTAGFLSEDEARVVAAIAEHIFPAGEDGPGAADAHVLEFIDSQLAGGYGNGERLYLDAPFAAPEDSGHGWQAPMTPAQAYRYGLGALGAYTDREYGRPFDALTDDEREAVLVALSTGEVDTFATELGAAEFFALVRQNVIEGLFCDPSNGGNHERLGWEWLGFPGPNPGGYAELIEADD